MLERYLGKDKKRSEEGSGSNLNVNKDGHYDQVDGGKPKKMIKH